MSEETKKGGEAGAGEPASGDATGSAEKSGKDDGGKGGKRGKDAAGKDAGKPAAGVQLPALPYLLIGIVVGALTAGVALGALLVAPRVNTMRHAMALKAKLDPAQKHDAAGKKDKSKDKDKKGEAGKPPVYKLDNIIVNPAGSQGQRFLMCSVAIESDDSKALDQLREHEIELRDKVVTLLSSQSLERLTADNCRDTLRAELQRAIHPVLGAEFKETELRVYLPQFVVQ